MRRLVVLAALVGLMCWIFRDRRIEQTFLVLDSETGKPIADVTLRIVEGAWSSSFENFLSGHYLLWNTLGNFEPHARTQSQTTDARGRAFFEVTPGHGRNVMLVDLPPKYRLLPRTSEWEVTYVMRSETEAVISLLRIGSETDKRIKLITRTCEDQRVVSRLAREKLQAQLESEGFVVQNDSRDALGIDEEKGFDEWQTIIALTAQRDGNLQRCCIEIRGSVADNWLQNLPMTISHCNKPLDKRFIQTLVAVLEKRGWDYQINNNCDGIVWMQRTPYAKP